MLYSSGGTSSVLKTLSVATGSVALISAPAAGRSESLPPTWHPCLIRTVIVLARWIQGGARDAAQPCRAWHVQPVGLGDIASACMYANR
jgi:hypothetical protein